ncbi:MAG: HAD family phosphatase [bacterium]|nr:HAD family phosphatase [bacterium]
MKITGAIFDLDGTLIDSMGVWDELADQYLLKNGIMAQKGVREQVKTMSLEESVAYFKEYYKMKKSKEQMIAEINGLITSEYEERIPIKEGTKELLEILKQKNVKMCIATATDKELVVKALKRLGILSYFRDVITCSEVGKSKEYPDIYDEALARLKTEKETTIVVEDAYHAICTAKAAGYTVLAVREQSEAENQERICGIADMYVETLKEVGKQVYEDGFNNSGVR